MEARYVRRKNELLQDCQVAPDIFDQVIPRLHHFMEPFVSSLSGQAPPQHARTYVSGLLSDVERKNVESIAYHFGQDRLDSISTIDVSTMFGVEMESRTSWLT